MAWQAGRCSAEHRGGNAPGSPTGYPAGRQGYLSPSAPRDSPLRAVRSATRLVRSETSQESQAPRLRFLNCRMPGPREGRFRRRGFQKTKTGLPYRVRIGCSLLECPGLATVRQQAHRRLRRRCILCAAPPSHRFRGVGPSAIKAGEQSQPWRARLAQEKVGASSLTPKRFGGAGSLAGRSREVSH